MSIEEHLDAWLEHTVREDIREQVRKLMLHEYNGDPDIYDHLGWPVVYRNIEYLIVYPKD
jgi:hypothetical protein